MNVTGNKAKEAGPIPAPHSESHTTKAATIAVTRHPLAELHICLSVRQLRDYQNYFLEVQGDYSPALPPHENTVASERLTLLQDEIGSRRGKQRPGSSVAERRHKQVVFWMKITAVVAVVGVLVAILTLCRPSSPPSPSPPVKLNAATAEPSPAPTTTATQSIPLTITTPSPSVAPVPFSPVTFAEISRVASDPKLTKLQKDEFRRKHNSKVVEWTVRVRSVERRSDSQLDSDFMVIFTSPNAKDNPTLFERGVAIFPANQRDDMLDLHSGDLIRFRGVLKFSEPIPQIVSVDNCQLLEHRSK